MTMRGTTAIHRHYQKRIGGAKLTPRSQGGIRKRYRAQRGERTTSASAGRPGMGIPPAGRCAGRCRRW